MDSERNSGGAKSGRYANLAARMMTYVTISAGVAFILVFLALAIQRMTYPFELEWMEGATVDHVGRIMDGHQIYTEPTVDWVPFRYAPFYYYVSALVSALFGVGFMPLRLVSILSSIGCLILIYLYVLRETRQAQAGAIGAGLYASTFVICGSWFDLARVDSLFMAVLLLAIYTFRAANTNRRCYFAGLLFALTFLTKQSAASVAALMLLWGLTVNWRLSVRAMAACFVALAVVTIAFNYSTEGWFGFYVYGMGRKLYPTSGWMQGLVNLLGVQLFRPLPMVMLAAAGYAAVVAWRRQADRRYHVVMLLAMIGTTYLTRINQGGWVNTFMPACAALAIVFGLAYGDLVKRVESMKSMTRPALLLAMNALVLMQFAFLAYDPRQHLPTADDERAGRELIQRIRAVDGEVLLVHHGQYGTMTGKGRYMHYQAMRDLFKTDEERYKKSLDRSARAAIASRRFSLVVTDRDWFVSDLQANYQESEPVFAEPGLFYPVAGWQVRPERMWIRKPDSALAPAADSGSTL